MTFNDWLERGFEEGLYDSKREIYPFLKGMWDDAVRTTKRKASVNVCHAHCLDSAYPACYPCGITEAIMEVEV
jgi:hypothetical protein